MNYLFSQEITSILFDIFILWLSQFPHKIHYSQSPSDYTDAFHYCLSEFTQQSHSCICHNNYLEVSQLVGVAEAISSEHNQLR